MPRQTKRTTRSRRVEICMTVQKDDVFVLGNPEAFRRIAEHLMVLSQSKPSEHYHMHLTWHLAAHRAKRQAVFVLASPDARRVHAPKRFELSFMVLQPAQLRELRRHERSGRLPRKWQRPEDK